MASEEELDEDGRRISQFGRVAIRNLGGANDTPIEFMEGVLSTATEPSVIAEAVVKGIKQDKAYILPHPEAKPGVEIRAQVMLAAFDDQ